MRHIYYTAGISDRLREARIYAHLNQSDLCRILRISRTALSQIENGSKSPTIHQIEIISRATGVNFEHLVLGTTPLQQALDQIDDITDSYLALAARMDRQLISQLSQMREEYIERYGHPDEDYPVRK